MRRGKAVQRGAWADREPRVHYLVMAALATGLLASCCARAPISPYAMTVEFRLFRYGALCGANHPAGLTDLEREDRAGRAAVIAATKPVDDIDAACKAHDLCYVRAGDDEPLCDELFLALLAHAAPSWRSARSHPPSDHGARCANLAREITLVISRFKPRPLDGLETFLPQAANAAKGLLNIVQLPFVAQAGYPSHPGDCYLDPTIKASAETRALDFLQNALTLAKDRGIAMPGGEVGAASGVAALYE